MEIEDDIFDSPSNNPIQTKDDDAYEEEEILVHVQFDCDVDTKLFNTEEPKIIGLDTDNPIMQMGPQFYRGTWQDAMGTSVFFAPDPDPPPIDPIFSRVKTPLMKLACHTRKLLLMSRVFIKPIAGQSSSQDTSENIRTEDTNQCVADTNQYENNRTNDTNQCANDTTKVVNQFLNNEANDTNNCAESRTGDTSEMEVERLDVQSSDNTTIESSLS